MGQGLWYSRARVRAHLLTCSARGRAMIPQNAGHVKKRMLSHGVDMAPQRD